MKLIEVENYKFELIMNNKDGFVYDDFVSHF